MIHVASRRVCVEDGQKDVAEQKRVSGNRVNGVAHEINRPTSEGRLQRQLAPSKLASQTAPSDMRRPAYKVACPLSIFSLLVL